MNIVTEINQIERKINEYYIIKKQIENYKYTTIIYNTKVIIEINPLVSNFEFFKNHIDNDHNILLKKIYKIYLYRINLKKKFATIDIHNLYKTHEDLLIKYIFFYFHKSF